MAIAKYYGAVRLKTNQNIDLFKARDVKTLLKSISKKYDIPYIELKKNLIYVNNVDIDRMDRLKTRLDHNDVVMIMGVTAGG